MFVAGLLKGREGYEKAKKRRALDSLEKMRLRTFC